MYKYVMVVLFSFACILGLVVLFDQAPPSAEKLAEEGKTQLKITASNFEFDKAEYKVKKGETLTVILVDKGSHGVEIKDLGIHLDKENLEQKITFDKAGTYPFQCSIMCGAGHLDMKSVIIVE